jgi:hypothetical protein
MNKKTTKGWLLGLAAVLLSTLTTVPVAFAGADHVRWDIIHIIPVPPGPGSVISAGGEAFAFATNPSTAMIRLTGSGTFVAPASGGTSSAVTGGGTWETTCVVTPCGVPTGSGTYRVTKLVSWEFANFAAAAPAFVDNIGDFNERANGNAVLLIEYDDGSQGMLGIGCHGPGAPNGIVEGVIATKDFVTYWSAEAPLPNVDANRTLFHVQ